MLTIIAKYGFQLENEIECIKHGLGVYNARADDWTVELTIIASNVNDPPSFQKLIEMAFKIRHAQR